MRRIYTLKQAPRPGSVTAQVLVNFDSMPAPIRSLASLTRVGDRDVQRSYVFKVLERWRPEWRRKMATFV